MIMVCLPLVMVAEPDLAVGEQLAGQNPEKNVLK
jgi:hypothetical protein